MTLRVTRKFEPIQLSSDTFERFAFEATVWTWTDGVVKIGQQNYEHFARGLLSCHIDGEHVDIATFVEALYAHNMTLKTILSTIEVMDESLVPSPGEKIH